MLCQLMEYRWIMKRPKLSKRFPCLVTSRNCKGSWEWLAGTTALGKISQIAEPLNALKRKGSKYMWTQAWQTAFETIKTLLVSPLILGHPDFNLSFIVYTDASDVGHEAVLVRPIGLGAESVITFASHSLNPAERNYSTTEQECLAVVWALEKLDRS